jgi:NADH-quinone oxidoreductase subunit G
VLGKTLPFDTAQQLRAAMFTSHPHLALLDLVVAADAADVERLAARPAKPGKERFGTAIADFYLTNPIARASAIMANVSAFHAGGTGQATGTHG